MGLLSLLPLLPRGPVYSHVWRSVSGAAKDLVWYSASENPGEGLLVKSSLLYTWVSASKKDQSLRNVLSFGQFTHSGPRRNSVLYALSHLPSILLPLQTHHCLRTHQGSRHHHVHVQQRFWSSLICASSARPGSVSIALQQSTNLFCTAGTLKCDADRACIVPSSHAFHTLHCT